MTPDARQPQREYIITEEDILILEDTFGVTMIMPRSRPHTTAPSRLATVDKIKQKVQEVKDIAAFVQTNMQEHNAATARTATLAFIPLAEELSSPSVSDARKREIIESLRQQAGEQE